MEPKEAADDGLRDPRHGRVEQAVGQHVDAVGFDEHLQVETRFLDYCQMSSLLFKKLTLE